MYWSMRHNKLQVNASLCYTIDVKQLLFHECHILATTTRSCINILK